MSWCTAEYLTCGGFWKKPLFIGRYTCYSNCKKRGWGYRFGGGRCSKREGHSWPDCGGQRLEKESWSPVHLRGPFMATWVLLLAHLERREQELGLTFCIISLPILLYMEETIKFYSRWSKVDGCLNGSHDNYRQYLFSVFCVSGTDLKITFTSHNSLFQSPFGRRLNRGLDKLHLAQGDTINKY